MANTLFHPKCGQRFPDTSRTGHCGACCRTFYGLAAFDRHQSHVGGKVVCADPADDSREWRLDKEGCWRFGAGMTPEARAKLRGE